MFNKEAYLQGYMDSPVREYEQENLNLVPTNLPKKKKKKKSSWWKWALLAGGGLSALALFGAYKNKQQKFKEDVDKLSKVKLSDTGQLIAEDNTSRFTRNIPAVESSVYKNYSKRPTDTEELFKYTENWTFPQFMNAFYDEFEDPQQVASMLLSATEGKRKETSDVLASKPIFLAFANWLNKFQGKPEQLTAHMEAHKVPAGIAKGFTAIVDSGDINALKGSQIMRAAAEMGARRMASNVVAGIKGLIPRI